MKLSTWCIRSLICVSVYTFLIVGVAGCDSFFIPRADGGGDLSRRLPDGSCAEGRIPAANNPSFCCPPTAPLYQGFGVCSFTNLNLGPPNNNGNPGNSNSNSNCVPGSLVEIIWEREIRPCSGTSVGQRAAVTVINKSKINTVKAIVSVCISNDRRSLLSFTLAPDTQVTKTTVLHCNQTITRVRGVTTFSGPGFNCTMSNPKCD